jgi:hypothetical protein
MDLCVVTTRAECLARSADQSSRGMVPGQPALSYGVGCALLKPPPRFSIHLPSTANQPRRLPKDAYLSGKAFRIRLCRGLLDGATYRERSNQQR